MDQINAINRMSSMNREQSLEKQDLQTTLRQAVTDLKEEVQGAKRIKREEQPSKSAESTDVSSELKEALSQKTENRVPDSKQNQLKADMANKRPGEMEMLAEDVSEAFAGVLSEDDIKKKKKGEKTRFEEKLERFEKMEAAFQDVEFADPQQAEELKQFFDNIGRLKHLKSKFKQLLFLEKRLEEQEEEKKRRERG